MTKTEEGLDQVAYREEALDEAKKIVSGDRDKQYGAPEDSFSDIAKLWSAYLGIELSSIDVATMMVLMKIGRNKYLPKKDTFIDICGYSACGYEVYMEEIERLKKA